jgi:hypothetical protein
MTKSKKRARPGIWGIADSAVMSVPPLTDVPGMDRETLPVLDRGGPQTGVLIA